MNRRAKIGGEIGINGEFYKGGQFLPSTKNPKRSKEKCGCNSKKKQQYEPYKWSVPPRGKKTSIFSLGLIGTRLQYAGKGFDKIEIIDEKIRLNERYIENYGMFDENYFLHGYKLKELIDMWNSGTRWI